MDRHGWLRIVEAFLSILIIMTAILIIVSRQGTPTNISEDMYQKQSQILEIISKNESLRSEILNGDNSDVNQTISKFISSSFGFATRICNLQDICNTNTPNDIEIYTKEIIITSTLTEYDPKKLRFFMWAK